MPEEVEEIMDDDEDEKENLLAKSYARKILGVISYNIYLEQSDFVVEHLIDIENSRINTEITFNKMDLTSNGKLSALCDLYLDVENPTIEIAEAITNHLRSLLVENFNTVTFSVISVYKLGPETLRVMGNRAH